MRKVHCLGRIQKLILRVKIFCNSGFHFQRSMNGSIHQKTSARRLRELDFLRGIAIILVIFRHQPPITFTGRIGLIGVDLFFVLSGFLVSGLLFKEFERFGSISPKRFLIRRGFKIYPIYYLSYPAYLLPIVFNGHFNMAGFLSDMTFLQNYYCAWGWAYSASWSLAVEEHFYFGLCFVLWLFLKKKGRPTAFSHETGWTRSGFEISVILLMIVCNLARYYSNTNPPMDYDRNFTMTHLRLDSLLAGVLVSYLHHFKRASFVRFFSAKKAWLIPIAVLGVSWTPFISPYPTSTPIFQTLCFTFLYISFSILLSWFLIDKDINRKLDKAFTPLITSFISKVGFCSYSIYVIHTLVVNCMREFFGNLHHGSKQYVLASSVLLVSIAVGMLMTYQVEKRFLKLRDVYFPGRT